MGNRARKSDDLAIGKDRRHERHVGYVRQPTLVRVIGDKHVAVADSPGLPSAACAGPPACGGGCRTPVYRENTTDQVAIDRRMEEHRRRHDETAFAV